MHILVDIDNIPENMRRRGLRGMADRFVELAMSRADPADTRLDVKLYGGWFDRMSLTKIAQDLSAEIQRDFPYPLIWTRTVPSRKITINAKLAYSLESLPKKQLTHTFRWREPSRKMTCTDPRRTGCQLENCPLYPVVGFVNKNACPVVECPVTPQHIFKAAGQQKLVDTMLVADVIFLARTNPVLFVVTNDDDIWPGFISAMVLGSTIVHVSTEAGWSKSDYRRDVPGKYFQMEL
jgi:hypothetical protein